MHFIGIEGVIVETKMRNATHQLLTITCKVKERHFRQVGSDVLGVVVLLNDQLCCGMMEQERKRRHHVSHCVNLHLITQNKKMNYSQIKICSVFKLQETNCFSSQLDLESQMKRDVLAVKLRFGITNSTDIDLQAFTIPDMMFAKIISACFGINKGIYNTLDMSLWEKGISSIEYRRRKIVQFLIKQLELNKGKGTIKFGSGQLTKKLEQFLHEESILVKEMIL